ncbi:MAG TPA: SIS domain-containing protein [Bacteroidales bacterium]|nr:SIS domain-containing protein [Bacteroidales bacterium]
MLVCGNGGSSSDSQHIAGELMKGFEHKRPLDIKMREKLIKLSGRGAHLAEKLQQGLPVISLSAHDSLITAVANDTDPDLIFAQQVVAYGKPEDVLLAISTSGNSANVIDAVLMAKALDMKVIGMTGKSGGNIAALCDIVIRVPESRTSFVQELHFPVYHAICMMIENHFFRK